MRWVRHAIPSSSRRVRWALAALALVCLVAALAVTTMASGRAITTLATSGPGPGRWAQVASMNTYRFFETATLLANGNVLVVGGCPAGTCRDNALASAEVYKPFRNTWTSAGSMQFPRVFHTATLLPDGDVLVAGGQNYVAPAYASAELYHPSTNSWSVAASMHVARAGQAAVLLSNRDVLVVGGFNNGASFTSGELYDPTKNTWTMAASMNEADASPTATVLSDGRVLVAGGGSTNFADAEIYDPIKNTWTDVARMTNGRIGAESVLLRTGKVLVIGGDVGNSSPSTSETYDPTTNTWTSPLLLNDTRSNFTASLLEDGQVLVAGGCCNPPGSAEPWTSAEVYDSAQNTWTLIANMNIGRWGHGAAVLPGGKVIVMGGFGVANTAITELFTPSDYWKHAIPPQPI
jgi:Kelch motif/Galactose oxidase, central domain